MKPLFRVVGGLDIATTNSKAELAAARRRARPILKRWLQRVEHHVLSKQLLPLDYLMAKELTNYPSANEGRCYAGQERLGAAVGSCSRTARSSLKRLCDAGLLVSKRGGPGRTASWSFCINGEPIFCGAKRRVAAEDRQNPSRLDRQSVANKPSDPDPIEHDPPPLPPMPNVLAEGGGLTGEVLPPESEITFDKFIRAIRGSPGRLGPACSIWSKLTRNERAAISNRVGRNGIDLDGMHASVWLKTRRWEAEPLALQCEDLAAALCSVMAQGHVHELKPHSAEWNAERARKVAAGESVMFMDERATQGFAWGVRRTP
jgi:hypothetical protein